jgi:hypothetical protein
MPSETGGNKAAHRGAPGLLQAVGTYNRVRIPVINWLIISQV